MTLQTQVNDMKAEITELNSQSVASQEAIDGIQSLLNENSVE